MPSKRHPRALNLDGAWLLTETPEGTKEVPGMSIVADSRGLTLTGPEVGTERTIPWQMTTGFQCQRPARLPDGSPATVLEVSLVNGRELQLLLPVTRVPPSETVVVETELAVLSDRYGGKKEGSKPKGRDTSAPADVPGAAPAAAGAPVAAAAAATDVPPAPEASAAPAESAPPLAEQAPVFAAGNGPAMTQAPAPAQVQAAPAPAPAVGRTPPPGAAPPVAVPAAAVPAAAVPAVAVPAGQFLRRHRPRRRRHRRLQLRHRRRPPVWWSQQNRKRRSRETAVRSRCSGCCSC